MVIIIIYIYIYIYIIGVATLCAWFLHSAIRATQLCARCPSFRFFSHTAGALCMATQVPLHFLEGTETGEQPIN